MTLPTSESVFTGELSRAGYWLVANLKSRVAWPTKVTKVKFRGCSLFLLPATQLPKNKGTTYQSLAIRLDRQDSHEEAQKLIFHFLSSLSWVHHQAISIEHWSGGNLPRPMSVGSSGLVLTDDFYEPYLPDPQNKRARWALAFYREGLSLNHIAYQCLSFFKILNILIPTGKDQIQWIKNNIGKVAEGSARERIEDIERNGDDVGEYLYVSNRCAVAHAGSGPTADPEDPADLKRLYEDLPLVRKLAEIAIENEFGIETSTSVYQNHFYELAGFRKIFGEERVLVIKQDSELAEEEWPSIPNLSIRLALHEPYDALENMRARVFCVGSGAAFVNCDSVSSLTGMTLALNFREERLQISLDQGLAFRDDGSERAMREATSVAVFVRDYIGNGILEVWDTTKNDLLGRCDAFIPTNIDFVGTMRSYEKIINQYNEEAERRARLSTTDSSEDPSSLMK